MKRPEGAHPMGSYRGNDEIPVGILTNCGSRQQHRPDGQFVGTKNGLKNLRNPQKNGEAG